MKNKKVAVVSGGAKGIGEAISLRLSDDGFTVAVVDMDKDATDTLIRQIQDKGREALALITDISDQSAVQSCFDTIEQTFGRCDVLVNNAGIAKTFPFETFPTDNWQATLNINLNGPLFMTQRAVHLMKKNHWGRIINISSISGIRAGAGRTAYGTSKAALIGLTRQMAIELAQYGITANSVAPGPVDTPLTRQLHSEETRESYHRLIPMRRYGTPEEIAATVAFLTTDGAAFITGHTIPVDGGFTAAGVLDI